MTVSPFRNLESDTADALDHVEQMDENVSDYKWKIVQRLKMPMRTILGFDDVSSWGEWREGELAGLDPAELYDEMRSFRGKVWADTALTWLKEGFPAVIIVNTPEYTGISDGRGRVSLAYGLGVKSLPAVVMTAGKLPHQR